MALKRRILTKMTKFATNKQYLTQRPQPLICPLNPMVSLEYSNEIIVLIKSKTHKMFC